MGHSFRSISYLILAFLLVLYALPRLPLLSGKTEAVTFSVIWLGFALLIIGAQLYQIIGDRSEQETLSPLAIREDEQEKKRTQSNYE